MTEYWVSRVPTKISAICQSYSHDLEIIYIYDCTGFFFNSVKRRDKGKTFYTAFRMNYKYPIGNNVTQHEVRKENGSGYYYTVATTFRLPWLNCPAKFRRSTARWMADTKRRKSNWIIAVCRRLKHWRGFNTVNYAPSDTQIRTRQACFYFILRHSLLVFIRPFCVYREIITRR